MEVWINDPDQPTPLRGASIIENGGIEESHFDTPHYINVVMLDDGR